MAYSRHHLIVFVLWVSKILDRAHVHGLVSWMIRIEYGSVAGNRPDFFNFRRPNCVVDHSLLRTNILKSARKDTGNEH